MDDGAWGGLASRHIVCRPTRHGRALRVRDGPHLWPCTPRGAVIRSAIELASGVERVFVTDDDEYLVHNAHAPVGRDIAIDELRRRYHGAKG